jgi:predicted MFS family arabinose efflux permease
VGYGCAALVVPPATRWLSKRAVIALLLVAAGVVTAALGESFDEIAYLAFGFFLYLTAQGVAICATTVLQEDTDDAFRGRLFAFYDVAFNVSLAAGAIVCAAFVPRDGRSPVLLGAVAAGYVVAAAGYWLFSRQSPPVPAGGPGTSTPSTAAQSSSS